MDLPTFIRSLSPDVEEAIDRAAKLFDEPPRAVKGWLYRERRPRPEKVPKLIQRSRGKLTFDGIYGSP